MKQPFQAVLLLLAIGMVILLPRAGVAADKIKVVATFSAISDMVANVAGILSI